MLIPRNNTPWKKSRKFGDLMGGRTHPKIADRVFNRKHNLTAPTEGTVLPIFIMDNPSRDFYFPISTDDIQAALDRLPAEHTQHLTHVWLQKFRKSDYQEGETIQGCFIRGSGVCLIVLHPFPKDLKMRFGKEKPSNSKVKYYQPFDPSLGADKLGWYLLWDEHEIRRYYLESLLLYLVGFTVADSHGLYQGKAHVAKSEKWAENYAKVWGKG